jgi:hypothetical protein
MFQPYHSELKRIEHISLSGASKGMNREKMYFGTNKWF